MPHEWTLAVRRWAALTERHRHGEAPSRNAEYLLYQTLVGAFPLEVERAKAYLLKSAREEKQHTSWMEPDADYESALCAFVEQSLGDRAFMADLESFAAATVAPGRLNSLSQTVIKLTAPGIPDLYQGSELWDLSLVDPDNRRAVDYTRRRQLLQECAGLCAEDALARSDDGLPKLWLIQRVLELRRAHPSYFEGDYAKLDARGRFSEHVVAFRRGEDLLVVAQRLPHTRGSDWSDTSLELPRGEFENALTGAREQGGARLLAQILANFPVAVWKRVAR
jgi:(1->4)-alpha-D-glucan 1-alpha-D-glucosylmutase